ncbi:MAG: DUF2993 domain-containing protein [Actinomycetota bacterium]|nr:DUF2993 domain-containing protein [Actinomycetota bacterium]
MRKIFFVLLMAVVGLLVAADFGARAAAANQLQHNLQKGVPSATSASVEIDSFPFLGRLLASGQVSTVHATVTDVDAGALKLARVTVDLHDVHIDRQALAGQRRVELTSIGKGTATAEITQEELSTALHVPVRFSNGKVAVRAGPLQATAKVTVQDNVIRLTAGPVSLPAIRIPKAPLLPCVANAEVLEGRIRVSCTLNQVPEELLRIVRSQTTTPQAPRG